MKVLLHEGLIISNRKLLCGVIASNVSMASSASTPPYVSSENTFLSVDTTKINTQAAPLIIAAACSGTQALNFDNLSINNNSLYVQQAPYASHRSSAQGKMLCFFSCGDQPIFPFDKTQFCFFNDTRLCSKQILHVQDEYDSLPSLPAQHNGITPVMSGYTFMTTSFVYNEV